MTSASYRQLLPLLCFLVTVFLSGCAASKSVIVLLPEEGRASGEVTVVGPRGSQVLTRSWQSVEIADGRPTAPTVLDQSTVQGTFGSVLSTLPLPPVHYLLYFKFDSTELLPDSLLLLPEIAQAVKKRHPAQLSVVGHADTEGTAAYNYQLGLSRARAVSELLCAHGAVPAGAEISSRGETEPAVKTADETPDQRNRRAEITVR